jgi:hypothetical protein
MGMWFHLIEVGLLLVPSLGEAGRSFISGSQTGSNGELDIAMGYCDRPSVATWPRECIRGTSGLHNLKREDATKAPATYNKVYRSSL